MSLKIVVVGGANGRFKEVIEKISTLTAKNSFAFAILTGDVFPKLDDPVQGYEDTLDALIGGLIDIPLTTYFALGKAPLHPKIVAKLEGSNDELCTNLYYLGKRSTLKTSDSIRIVSLGGTLDPNITTGPSKDKYTPFHSDGDARSLRGANTADILITSEWPSGIRNGSKVTRSSEDVPDTDAQRSIADLCAALRPRYHFSTSSLFYEREPFRHPQSSPETNSTEEGYKVTRFISLSSFGNPQKQKWIYAFTLDPSSITTSTLPPGTTPTPFQVSKKRTEPHHNEQFSRFSRERHAPKKPKPGPDACFFCLSNPNLAAHLVVSIGTEAYITTSKGPLISPSLVLSSSSQLGNANLPFPLLIIPLAHAPTLASIPDRDSRKASITEMMRYRSALNTFIQSHGKGKLGSVTWEVSRSHGIHTVWQFCAVPADMCRRGIVEAGFLVEAENHGFPKFEKGKGADRGMSEERLLDTADAFRVWIWAPAEASAGNGVQKDENADLPDESQGADEKPRKDYEASLTLLLSSSFRFDLQMGRSVMAKLLGVEDRVDWRKCEQSERQETSDAEAFKEAFKDFDFTLQ